MQLVFIIRLSSLCQCYIMHVDWFHILCCHPVSVLHYTCGLIWYFVSSPCVRVTLYMWIDLILCVVTLCPCYIIHVDWVDTLCCHPVSVLHYTCGLIWYFVLSPCVHVTLYMWIDFILCVVTLCKCYFPSCTQQQWWVLTATSHLCTMNGLSSHV